MPIFHILLTFQVFCSSSGADDHELVEACDESSVTLLPEETSFLSSMAGQRFAMSRMSEHSMLQSSMTRSTDVAGHGRSRMDYLHEMFLTAQMLTKEAATPTVVRFVTDVLETLEVTVLPAIERAHDSDHEMLESLFAQITSARAVGVEREARNADLEGQMMDASQEHQTCRAEELVHCESLAECRSREAVAEAELADAEATVEELQSTHSGDWCAPDGNTMSLSFRNRARPRVHIYLEAEDHADAKRAIYNDIVEECEAKELSLHAVTVSCNRMQDVLETSSCTHFSQVFEAQREVAALFNSAAAAYETAAQTATAEAEDRKVEFVTLQQTMCLLNAINVGPAPGEPCDEDLDPNQADAEFQSCHNLEVNTTFLDIAISVVGEAPVMSPLPPLTCSPDFRALHYAELAPPEDCAGLSVCRSCEVPVVEPIPPIIDPLPEADCGVPPEQANAVASRDVVPVGGYATFVCRDGFSVGASGNFEQRARCNANSQFHEIIPCLPTICGTPPNVRNAVALTQTQVVHGGTASYRCLDGYQMSDGSEEFSASCTNGAFGASAACAPVSCGSAPSIQNAVAVAPTATVSFPDRLRYDCQSGYTVDGEVPSAFEISCLADGEFSRGGCRQIECPVLPILTNAVWTEESRYRVDSDSILSFTILQYQCIEGFSWTGGASDVATAPRNVECKPTGLFNEVRPCVPINDCLGHSCGPFGTCVDQHMDYTCQCLDGYEIQEITNGEGNQEKACGDVDDCFGAQCGEGGTCQDQLLEYSCNCREGFERFEIATGERTCARVECGSPPVVENALVSSSRDGGGKAVFDDVTEYECVSGYSPDGRADSVRSFSVTCRASGQFSAVRTCMPINCGEPQHMAHASVASGAVSFPEAADYHCDSGYTTTGFAGGPTSLQRHCTDSGELVTLSLGRALLVTCLPVTCGTPPSFDSAMVGDPAVRGLGEIADYTCIEGHSTIPRNPAANTFSSECLPDGSWRDAPGSCSPVMCALPDDTSTFGGPPTVGGQEVSIADFTMPVTYTCKDGYTVDGNPTSDTEQTATCTARGVLHVRPCVPVVCRSDAIATGLFAHLVSHARDYTFGDTVNVQCNDGWEVAAPGSHRATRFEVECLATGLFSSPAICQNINDCEGHTCGAHGRCVDGIQGYSCNCQHGFEESIISGEKICGNIDDCNGISCGSAGVCTDLLSTFACECGEGFENEGASDSACIPKVCHIPLIENSQMEGSLSILFPESVQVRCRQGHISHAGEEFAVACMADGPRVGGSEAIPSCSPRSCGTAPQLLHAATAPDAGVEFTFGDGARYTCAGGLPEIEFECGASGWAASPGSHSTCQNSCGQPVRPVNGRRDGDGALYHPQVAQLSCDEGYTYLASGAAAASATLHQECLPTGEYQPLDSEVNVDAHGRVVCVPVACHRPSAPANWRWEGRGDFNTRSPATLACELGHTSNGMPHAIAQQSIICNHDGSQTQLPAPCEPIGHRISGTVSDAVNGRTLANAEVIVTAGGRSNALTTNLWGVWTLDSVPIGAVLVSIRLASYSELEFELNLAGDIDHGPADASLNPHLTVHSWRVVLSWQSRPSDLDGHVTRHPAEGGLTLNERNTQRTHLSWQSWGLWMGSMSNYIRDESKPYAMLDRDDTDQYGPETITFFNLVSCEYDCKFVYRVWDYCSLPTALVDESEAVVRVYNSAGLHSTFNIGQHGDNHDSGTEKRWDVFMLDASSGDVQIDACSGSNCPPDNTVSWNNHGFCWER